MHWISTKEICQKSKQELFERPSLNLIYNSFFGIKTSILRNLYYRVVVSFLGISIGLLILAYKNNTHFVITFKTILLTLLLTYCFVTFAALMFIILAILIQKSGTQIIKSPVFNNRFKK